MKSFTAESAASAPPPPAAAKKTGDLKVRVLSALVMGPLVLLAVWYGGWVFRALLVVSALVAIGEWVNLVASERMPEAFWHSILAMVVVLVAYALGGPLAAMPLAVALGVIVQISTGGKASWLLGFGIPYVTAGVAGLAWLREHPGLPLVLFCLAAIWATDIGAYAAGRSIGGPKLAPRISPKKTWAGLIGGMVAAAVFAYGVALAADAARPWMALLIGPLLAVVGQAGDLFESWVKRRYNVKDSSNLIPGHGGLLDRIDGLLVAAPVLAVLHATLGAKWQWW
ncbi:MAG TPA: phosphatidate cytidylyltransferase [Azospirillum sp.]|nr:phosphatidate cytidylyltransferase [Azospirillum sp.]